MWLDEQWTQATTLNLFTGVAASIGFGGLFEKQWFAGICPPAWKKLQHFNTRTIPNSASLFGHLMSTKRVLFHSDNQVLLSVINNKACKDKVAMILVRRLVHATLKYNVLAKHVFSQKKIIY